MLKTLKYYYIRFGIKGVICAIKAKFTKSNPLLKVIRKDIRFPFYLRLRTSDTGTFNQVFMNREFDFVVQHSPKIIVDAGANIGLASIYFANRYLESRIIAIEPEASNYDMLTMNIAPYVNILPVHAALWNTNEEVRIIDPGRGKWAFITQQADSDEAPPGNMGQTVQAFTVDRIMKDHGIDKIDILKMDIEGAEREVFMDASAWIEKVDTIIIELHEGRKPGCQRSFDNISQRFAHQWRQGEKIYLSRRNILLNNR